MIDNGKSDDRNGAVKRRLFEVEPKWWTPAELKRVATAIYREVARRKAVLFAGRLAKAETAKSYRDPDNQFNTWNGRGRRPKWLKGQLARGKKLEDLEVVAQPNEQKLD